MIDKDPQADCPGATLLPRLPHRHANHRVRRERHVAAGEGGRRPARHHPGGHRGVDPTGGR